MRSWKNFYKGQKAGDTIELMNQTNDVLTDVPFMETNQTDGHLTRVRTGLAHCLLAQALPGHAAFQVAVEPGQGRLRHP